MSTKPSRKEQRRQAAKREQERRAREAESQLVQSASNLDWGSATLLDLVLRAHIMRLGGVPANPTSNCAVEILSQQIRWPKGTFRSSEQRYREALADSSTASMTDTDIQDLAPVWCHDFSFAKNGSFYVGWEADFVGVNASKIVPLGFDAHYFYLIGHNNSTPANPLVFHVDHEAVSEPPYHRDHATVSSLLVPLIVV